MKDGADKADLSLRPPEVVMRLSRMGQAFPTRLSFLRVLLRKLAARSVRPERVHWSMDADGVGQAVYTLDLGERPISLVALSQALPDDQRTDRVIATAWDAAFVLYDGRPDSSELARLAAQAPLQEAGRFEPQDLILSRANKSMRAWDHVVTQLRRGQQPDAERLAEVGYLMRTTAVYGNGKFGIADRHLYADNDLLSGPFAAEMLCVWLIRQFTLDLAEHVGGAAIEPGLKRRLGVGNATGLGMAPFLVSHPVLLHNWVRARETALARVLAVPELTPDACERLRGLHHQGAHHLATWQVPDPEAAATLQHLRSDWAALADHLPECQTPKDVLRLSADLGVAAQELTISLLIECFPEDVDDLSDEMGDLFGAEPALLPDTDALRQAIETDWTWAMRDYSQPDEIKRFWYTSANKLEPRIGDRHAEPGAECERPLTIARDVAALFQDLPGTPQSTCTFLERHPKHAFAVRRVSTLSQLCYAEIRDNLIAATCRPIDMLRFKLAFFGATGFDPKSELWTRITLAQGAPLIDELGTVEMPWLCEVTR